MPSEREGFETPGITPRTRSARYDPQERLHWQCAPRWVRAWRNRAFRTGPAHVPRPLSITSQPRLAVIFRILVAPLKSMNKRKRRDRCRSKYAAVYWWNMFHELDLIQIHHANAHAPAPESRPVLAPWRTANKGGQMKRPSMRRIGMATTALGMCLMGVGFSLGQAQPEQAQQMAEDVFLNVPALSGIPVDQFMDTMGMIAASLSVTCSDCHVTLTGGWEEFAEETPLKQTARGMIEMVNRINTNEFGGLPFVTCYTCHRGNQKPHVVPDLAIQYNVPPEDPHDIFFPTQAIPGMPSAEQVFDKYMQALGGMGQAANLTSFVATGTYSGYDTELQPVPMEVYSRAPDQRTTVVHIPYGDSVRTYNGRDGWISSPDRALPLLPLTGGNLEGARTDAIVSYPSEIQPAFSQWRVGFSTFIDDREVQVIQGTNPGQGPVNMYFDVESGLLVRLVRYTETKIGTVPTQIDYADYRSVAGLMMPYSTIVTWTNGQATIEYEEIQANVSIDAGRFATPAPSPPPRFD